MKQMFAARTEWGWIQCTTFDLSQPLDLCLLSLLAGCLPGGFFTLLRCKWWKIGAISLAALHWNPDQHSFTTRKKGSRSCCLIKAGGIEQRYAAEKFWSISIKNVFCFCEGNLAHLAPQERCLLLRKSNSLMISALINTLAAQNNTTSI